MEPNKEQGLSGAEQTQIPHQTGLEPNKKEMGYAEWKQLFTELESKKKMGYAEWIHKVGTVVVLSLTSFFIFNQVLVQNNLLKEYQSQVLLQNNLLQAQILAHRYQALLTTDREITEGELLQVHRWPGIYMSDKVYKKYKDNPDAMRKYLGALKLYVFLAFTYSLKSVNLPDPLGYEWTEKFAGTLLEYEEFCEVHALLKEYYPKFASFLDSKSKP